MLSIVEARRRKDGLFRRATFGLVASMAPASAMQLADELRRLEEGVRRWRERRGPRAEAVELVVDVDRAIEPEVQLALDDRLALPSFRALMNGLDFQLRVEVEEPTGIDFFEDETESVVTPAFTLRPGQTRLEALRADLAERGEGFAVVDEREDDDVTTVIGRSELEGLWWTASVVGPTDGTSLLVRVVAEGTDLASVKESHDAVVHRRGRPSDRLLVAAGAGG